MDGIGHDAGHDAGSMIEAGHAADVEAGLAMLVADTGTSPLFGRATVRKILGRNAPCPCGSGEKYKHCCIGKHSSTFRDYWPWFTLLGVIVVAVVLILLK